MQVVRIKNSFFDAGQEVWAAGVDYPPTAEALRQVEINNAELLDVPDASAVVEQVAADVPQEPANAVVPEGALRPAGKRRGHV